MEDFTEEHSKTLLSKEWLVKVDAATSTPYLFKFALSPGSSDLFLLITDTRKSWTEVLPKKHISRRWRQCNPNLNVPEDEDVTSKILSTIHSASGISEASFDILESPIADLSFELEFEGFKWRWDTFLLGPRTSSDIISKHLIMPLITMTHVAFYSADPVSELLEEDLEKVVDKIGRTARRSVDTHVKQTISKPRIATTLRRVSALLGLVPDLPSISSETEPNVLEDLLEKYNSKQNPTLRVADEGKYSRPTGIESERDTVGSSGGPSRFQATDSLSARHSPVAPPDVKMDSETESENEDKAPADQPSSPIGAQAPIGHRRETPSASGDRPSSTYLGSQTSEALDDTKSTSSPPSKKTKLNTKAGRSKQDSDSDSDDSRAGRSSQNNAGAGRGRGGPARGVRQPLKRGVKRF